MKLRQIVYSILSLCLEIYRDETGGFWLWKYFQSLKSYTSDAATEIWDLPKVGILSNIMLEAYAIAGSENLDVYMSDLITKVEVIGNGSTVIQSLTGLQIQSSNAYDDGHYPLDKEHAPDGGCYGYFDIRFGRYPGDPKYALDCSKWDSLELKITYATAAGTTIDTLGFATTTVDMTLYGLYSPDGSGLSPVGYIRKEQKKTYTTSAGSEEDLALPDDYPFRRLLLAVTTHGTVPNSAYDYVTIEINDGARKPIDNMRGAHLMRFDQGLRGNPVFIHNKRYYIAAGTATIHPVIGFVQGAAAIAGVGTISGSSVVDIANVNITQSGTGGCYVSIWGFCPGNAVAIDLEKWSGKDGLEAMMDAWGFDQKADIHLKHTQGTGSLAEQIILEQYATHPI